MINRPLLMKIGLTAITIWILLTTAINLIFGSNAGTIGDSFGAVNALFSGLAFCGIVYTLYLQQKDQEQQQKEQEQQRKNFQREMNVLRRQRRDASFFTMLQFHFDIVKNIYMKNHLYDRQGLRAIQFFGELFNDSNLTAKPFLETDLNTYMAHYKKQATELLPAFNQYMHSVLSIYKYVKSLKLRPKAKRRYLNTLKGYFTPEEKVFFFYYLTLSTDENEKREFKRMEQELKLIKDLNGNDIFGNESFLGLRDIFNRDYPYKADEANLKSKN